MSFRVKMLGGLLGGLFIHFSTLALTQDNPYRTIVDRNPFGLNPPPPPATNAPPEPPKNVKFNGITNVGGRKKAFFTIMPKDAKEQPQYVSLSETERTDVLEVTKIFDGEGEVEVINSGITMVLNFKNNGNKAATLASNPSGPSPMMPGQSAAPVASLAPVAAAVYSPGDNLAVFSPSGSQGGGAGSNPNSYAGGGSVNNLSPAVYRPPTVSSTGSSQQMDLAAQRQLMMENHARQDAQYQSGQGRLINFQTPGSANPAVYSPGGTTSVRVGAIPPPPMPPAPPGGR